ncbi:lipocalin family protein [Pontimicrobium sp. SW4]|uniref:Lipocalin family protein n=1 Tax=Pontimicrobium sp. SW4 TaxID=3153519 RepID=A0AAU7BWD5_9FLAO
MKKVSPLLVLVSIISIYSCSIEEAPSINSEYILGTWVGEDLDYSGSTVTEISGQTVTADFVGEAYDLDFTLTFSENPKEISTSGSYSVELTTTIEGQVSVTNVENIQFLNDGTWTKSGDEVTIIYNGRTSVFRIIELTEDSLILSLPTVEDLSQGGAIITTTIDMTITFSK